MRSVLVPVDGSKRSDAAVRCVARQVRMGQVEAVHLLAVQPPLGAYIGRFVGRNAVRDFQHEQGQRALASAKQLLDEAGIAYSAHIMIGESAETIATIAEQLPVHEIIMGDDGIGFLGGLNLHSLVARVIRRANLPVSVVKDIGPDPEAERMRGLWQLRPTH
jgi:nucleotide-binding universal stress UspA family protein